MLQTIIDTLLIAAGFLLLIKGGDKLVLGAVNIARAVKLSPMVIGLTIVGFGTSMPELLVSTQAAIKGSPAIAIGNVVGSNIADIALILGIAAIITPLSVSKKTLNTHLPIMTAAVLLLTIVGISNDIGRLWGLVMLALLGIYTAAMIIDSKKHPDPEAEKQLEEYPNWKPLKATIITLLAFAALMLGANILVQGATAWAQRLGDMLGADPQHVERIIGLTIVAVGTSLPELFATLMAARRAQADIALGNIIGSVTFNILCVIGTAATIHPIHNSKEGFIFSYAAMALIAILFYLMSATKKTITRIEGILLLIIYMAYIAIINL